MVSPEATRDSSLLLTLEEISNLVAHCHNATETLANIVQLIQARFATDVCSVYVLTPDRAELVLGATVGLKPESVGRVRMQMDEGLTGLVAEKLEPVMVAEAVEHPRFKYFPDAGEDVYHSFLGVPLVETGNLQGVLVVQTTEPRDFSSSEVRMLVAVAAQLAPLISGAQVLEQLVAAAHEEPHQEAPAQPAPLPDQFSVTTLSRGIGVGLAYVMDDFERDVAVTSRSNEGLAENARLEAAMQAAREDLTRVSAKITELVGDHHGAILQAQQLLLQDRAILQDLQKCLNSGMTAEAAVVDTLHKYVAAFERLANPYFRERQYDIKDIFRRVLWHLRPQASAHEQDGTRLVLIAQDASVTDLFSVELERVAAVIVRHGGAQSHAAILARSLGLPMVGSAPDKIGAIEPGQRLLVDADQGIVYVDPNLDLLASYQSSRSDGDVRVVPLTSDSEQTEATVTDTQLNTTRVEANINLLGEVPRAVANRATGVGLFRSEFLFLARRTLPTEEEQVGIYTKLLSMLDGRPASIRTFDLRPDKLAHSACFGASTRAQLDWRLVLNSPLMQRLFKDQVRAILRAASRGPARILIPLVTRTEQLEFALETIRSAADELQRQGLEHGKSVPVGVMVEIAAVAPMIPHWANRIDYFALGTNDLLASSFGVNREDPVGVTTDDLLHPGWLRLIHGLIQMARAANRPTTVCGEMAADPRGALPLLAFGVSSLSVPGEQLEMTRRIVRAARADRLSTMATRLLDVETTSDAQAIVAETLAD